MIYHLTAEKKFRDADSGEDRLKAICGEILQLRENGWGAILFMDHKAGDTHYMYRELCPHCESIADRKPVGVYR